MYTLFTYVCFIRNVIDKSYGNNENWEIVRGYIRKLKKVKMLIYFNYILTFINSFLKHFIFVGNICEKYKI